MKIAGLFSKEKIASTMRIGGGVILIVTSLLYTLDLHLKKLYAQQFSTVLRDRNGEEIELKPNIKQYYARETFTLPKQLKELLLRKEDRYFYFHLGINPISIGRDLINLLSFSGDLEGSSTITQQLVKNLLGNESKRTVFNKLLETIYAFGLEIFTPKDTILTMYANTAYFGKQAQGLSEASNYYFGVDPQALTEKQGLALLAALSNPSERFPGSYRNNAFLPLLARKMGIVLATSTEEDPLPSGYKPRRSNAAFELQAVGASCSRSCSLTLDKELTERLRKMLAEHLASKAFQAVENGAIVVIRVSPKNNENELLSIIGSPNPQLQTAGSKINLATEPRPIGSTIKPFIYTKAFERGARPYSLVDDREYRYTIGTGYSFYPKNYDGQYRGIVTLHEALSNSLNVPSVKVLEFVGIDTFADFLTDQLEFHPRQPLKDYELGIALGGLEMDLLTLTNYFSIFPNGGKLKPLVVGRENADKNLVSLPMSNNPEKSKDIFEATYVELTNKILSDRVTGVDQFGIKSNLNLTQINYGVKTGTSYDFHDSWTVGFTPDFVVGVWLGNSDNTPIRQISGQAGAGTVWHDAMEILLNSPYNLKTPLEDSGIKTFVNAELGRLEYGLQGDDYETMRKITLNEKLIIEPNTGDVFLLTQGMEVPFRASINSLWTVNGVAAQESPTKEFMWRPTKTGNYSIEAVSVEGSREVVKIFIQDGE